jgi:hypothetical protein
MFYTLQFGDGDKAIAKIQRKHEQDPKDPDDLKRRRRIDHKPYNPMDFLFIKQIDKADPNAIREITLNGAEKFKPLMCRADNEGHAQRIFIAGGTLSGKSFMAGKLAKDYQNQFPKNKVIMFSWVDKDKSYDDKIRNLHRIRIDESILDDPIELAELHDSCVIFDDAEHFTDKYISAELERLRNSVINAGRHLNIDVIVARQNLLDGAKTKTCLNSAFCVIGFPHSGGRYQLGEFLKRHMCLPQQTIHRILNLPSRWVLISRSAPMYCLYQTGIFML